MRGREHLTLHGGHPVFPEGGVDKKETGGEAQAHAGAVVGAAAIDDAPARQPAGSFEQAAGLVNGGVGMLGKQGVPFPWRELSEVEAREAVGARIDRGCGGK